MSEKFITTIWQEYDGRGAFLLFFGGHISFLSDYSHNFLDSPLPTEGNFLILNDTEEVMSIVSDDWRNLSLWIMKPFFSLQPIVHSTINLGDWISLSIYDARSGKPTHYTIFLDANNKWVEITERLRVFPSFRKGIEFIMDSAPHLIEWVIRDLDEEAIL